jgi:hypothetical protein
MLLACWHGEEATWKPLFNRLSSTPEIKSISGLLCEVMLLIACLQGHRNLFDYCISYAPANKDFGNHSALDSVLYEGCYAQVWEAALDLGWRPLKGNRKNFDVLLHAPIRVPPERATAIIDLLLSRCDYKIEAHNIAANTSSNSATLKSFLQHVNVDTLNKSCLLHRAIRSNYRVTFEIALEAGADINYVPPVDLQYFALDVDTLGYGKIRGSALWEAAFYEQLGPNNTREYFAKILLDAGADPLLKGHDGLTALEVAREDSKTSELIRRSLEMRSKK